MTAQHTPEPWRTIKDHNGNDYGVQMGSAGGFALYRDANAEANSRRIVACVNACAGATDKQVQAIADTGGIVALTDKWWSEIERLKQQRDTYAEDVRILEQKVVQAEQQRDDALRELSSMAKGVRINIPTDAMEQHVASHVRRAIAPIKQQRDDLLAALHEIAGHSGHILSGSLASMRKIAIEAIAKARGGK